MGAVGLLVCLGLASSSVGQQPARKSPPAAQPGQSPLPPLVPDPNWVPAPADRVAVRQPGFVGLPDRASCDRYGRSLKAGDAAGWEDARRTKGAITLEAETPVLVIEPYGLPAPPRSRGVSRSIDGRTAEIQEGAFRAYEQSKVPVAVEVRVLGGPHKDQVRFVPMDGLARMVPAAPGWDLQAGGRAVLVARSAPMGDDPSYLNQFLNDPDGGSNREHVVILTKGARLTVLEVGPSAVKVKVQSASRHAGKVGYVKADGLEPAKGEAVGPARK